MTVLRIRMGDGDGDVEGDMTGAVSEGGDEGERG